MMPESQNLKDKLFLLGVILVVLGAIVFLAAGITLFICLVALSIKAIIDHVVTRVRTMTNKGPSQHPRPHSRKTDVMHTPVPAEERLHIAHPIINGAEDLAERLRKVREANSKIWNLGSKATTDTRSEFEAWKSKAANANYKYVTADLNPQLHGIRYQGSRSDQTISEKDKFQSEQAAQTAEQGAQSDEVKSLLLLRKAAVAELRAPTAPSETPEEKDWIDVDDNVLVDDDVIDMCPPIAKNATKPCTEYIIPRLMPKESTKANDATMKPFMSFDEFKARRAMQEKSTTSFDEFAAKYYKNTTANEKDVFIHKAKRPRVEMEHEQDGAGNDTLKERKNFIQRNLDAAMAQLHKTLGEKPNLCSTAMPWEADKRVQKNDGDMASKKKEKASQSGSLFLDLLPAEIRNLIYSYVLTTPVPIRNAGELVEQMAVGLIVADEPDPSMSIGIDAALMRACRRIYAETLPVLYGENTFHFKNVDMLKKFRNSGLVESQDEQYQYRVLSTFNLKPNPNGRLSVVRKLSLNLTAEGEHMHLRNLRPGDRYVPSRTRIVHEWGSLLHQDRRGILVYDYIDFPMLEFLSLDFSEWRLGENEGLVIRLFIDKFRTTEGLRKLVVKGLSHEKSLGQLKKQLLRAGGVFEAHKRN